MREREARKLTLEDISSSTKIRTQFLAAIEQEAFDQLPGGIISKGFIRAYARELGVDDQQAIADYLETSQPKQPMFDAQRPPEAPVRDRKKISLATQVSWALLAVALATLAFGFLALGYYKRELQSFSTDVMRQKQDSAQSRTRESPPSGINAPKADPAARKASVPIPPPSSGNFYVSIEAHQDAWLSIIVDGNRIMQGTLLATTKKIVEGRNQILIRAGNVGALDFSFNGEYLPKQGDYDEAKTLKFNPSGLQSPVPLPTTAASVEQ
jgi:cytoskeletal protein RodZ